MNTKGYIFHRISLSVIAALSLISITYASSMSDAAIAQRIAPVGSVYLQGEAPETPALPLGLRAGDTVYNTSCIACHATGVAGAPKAGDGPAWKARLEQGRSVVNNHAISGFNAMPALGACMDCSNEEIIAAIDYMLSM